MFRIMSARSRQALVTWGNCESRNISGAREICDDVRETFLQACRNGDVRILRGLLENWEAGRIQLNLDWKGTDRRNLGWTGLHLAAYFGNTEVIKILLDYGAQVDIFNSDGDTALHKAALTGRRDIVLLLIEARADVHRLNGLGLTPLSLA
ncbi:unnamed protein product, partial [Cyprideis torosa]